jgi:hypothetical protein
VASVNPASGLVAAVGPGTATISATSEGKTGGATITVVGATVSILSATIAGTQVPVNVAAVAAGIDVSIGMTSGAQLIDSLLLRIDNTRAAAISFGTSGPPSSVVLSVNTASFNASHIPSWTNGQHSMHADLYPRGSSSPTVSNPMFLTLVNPDVVYFNPAGLVHTGTCSPTFPTVCAGGFTVSSFPVNYSGAISSITYFFNVCGAGAGVTAPNFTATIPCAFISDSGNNAVQQINVRYPAGYTQTVAPRLFMTSASPGFVPGQPQWTPTNYDTDEDNVPPTVVRVPAVVAVTVFPRSITLNQGSSVQLTARVSTSGQPTVTVTYSSSDPSVASVSASGLVTALSSATAAIEVTACSSINQCVAQITLVTVN